VLSYDFALSIGVRSGLISVFRMFTDTLAIARALGVHRAG
jgi:ketosteroid isomerase-like protein